MCMWRPRASSAERERFKLACVIRTSRLENDVQNGCTVGSRPVRALLEAECREDALVERDYSGLPGTPACKERRVDAWRLALAAAQRRIALSLWRPPTCPCTAQGSRPREWRVRRVLPLQ